MFMGFLREKYPIILRMHKRRVKEASTYIAYIPRGKIKLPSERAAKGACNCFMPLRFPIYTVTMYVRSHLFFNSQ